MMRQPLRLTDSQLNDVMRVLAPMPQHRRPAFMAALANEIAATDHAVIVAEWPDVLWAAWNRTENTIDRNRFTIVNTRNFRNRKHVSVLPAAQNDRRKV